MKVFNKTVKNFKFVTYAAWLCIARSLIYRQSLCVYCVIHSSNIAAKLIPFFFLIRDNLNPENAIIIEVPLGFCQSL